MLASSSSPVVAALPVSAWAPSPATVAVTWTGEILVSLQTAPGRTRERLYPVDALRPEEPGDPVGSLVLADGDARLVLPIAPTAAVGELLEFSRMLAVAVSRSATASC